VCSSTRTVSLFIRVFLPHITFFLTSHNLAVGYRWASTILAILATVMGVFPFLFYKFGPLIRRKSRYAQELARLEQEERERLKFIELRAVKRTASGISQEA
jgi:hypothetical protein